MDGLIQALALTAGKTLADDCRDAHFIPLKSDQTRQLRFHRITVCRSWACPKHQAVQRLSPSPDAFRAAGFFARAMDGGIGPLSKRGRVVNLWLTMIGLVLTNRL